VDLWILSLNERHGLGGVMLDASYFDVAPEDLAIVRNGREKSFRRRHDLFLSRNDERMHHYQRRRTSITGLVL
jgi:hypothetical protein